MNDQQYQRAKEIKEELRSIKGALEDMESERNFLDLPEEMFMRHCDEKRGFLESEKARLEAEFAAL